MGAVAGGLDFVDLGRKVTGKVSSTKVVASVSTAMRNGARRGRPSGSRVVEVRDKGSSEEEDDGGCLLWGEEAR